jgi:hypothetical protein
MLLQIVIGAVLVAITAIVQAAFMLGALRVLQALRTNERDYGHHHATLIIAMFVVSMFIAMIIDMAIWASVYRAVGAVGTFEEALFVSAGSFTTIGYGDVLMETDWRLLVGIEGANGMIIFGWATALIVAAIQHFYDWTPAEKSR